MVINDLRKKVKTIPIKEIKKGQVFDYLGEYYIKTDPEYGLRYDVVNLSTGVSNVVHYHAVNLSSGVSRLFDGREPVEFLDVELIIK